MICGNDAALKKYLDKVEYSERQLENFESDIEDLMSVIEESILRVKEIEAGYESFDFTEEWADRVRDMI